MLTVSDCDGTRSAFCALPGEVRKGRPRGELRTHTNPSFVFLPPTESSPCLANQAKRGLVADYSKDDGYLAAIEDVDETVPIVRSEEKSLEEDAACLRRELNYRFEHPLNAHYILGPPPSNHSRPLLDSPPIPPSQGLLPSLPYQQCQTALAYQPSTSTFSSKLWHKISVSTTSSPFDWYAISPSSGFAFVIAQIRSLSLSVDLQELTSLHMAKTTLDRPPQASLLPATSPSPSVHEDGHPHCTGAH